MPEVCDSMLAYGGLHISSEMISLDSFLYYDYTLSVHSLQIRGRAMYQTLVSLCLLLGVFRRCLNLDSSRFL
jgi:hypothetical protein